MTAVIKGLVKKASKTKGWKSAYQSCKDCDSFSIIFKLKPTQILWSILVLNNKI